MNTTLEHLEQAKRSVIGGIDAAIVTLKGSVELRNAVEELLIGTPYEKPPDSIRDDEGLYGRLKNALGSTIKLRGCSRAQTLIIEMTNEKRDELIYATAQAVRAIIEHSQGYPLNSNAYDPSRVTQAYNELDTAITAIKVMMGKP